MRSLGATTATAIRGRNNLTSGDVLLGRGSSRRVPEVQMFSNAIGGNWALFMLYRLAPDC